jgi:hypothetical protein
MYTWGWWGLISLGLCGLSWFAARRSQPPPPAGIGPWEPSWAVVTFAAIRGLLPELYGSSYAPSTYDRSQESVHRPEILDVRQTDGALHLQ